MKNIFFIFCIFSLLLSPLSKVLAQDTQNIFDTSDFPQWAQDLRRWNIVSFGVFPFSMFFVSFATDIIRWNDANGMDFSADGRRYAPWPLKSAGAIELTNDEFKRNIMMAIGLSATVAIVDLIIVRIKRDNERRRIDSRPAGSIIIERSPILFFDDDPDE
jgi:hypothetical protein